ncbi:hypothetical protein HEP87_03080 [Streptomyces sp. S1D4-11]|nr:hypothetical protein [Streptomyces sp. S1D4-11]QIY93332.1 hypothetical protein HEP87_03080 [Streptomyces sp. S1D4-11]
MILKLVSARSEPVQAKDISVALGKGVRLRRWSRYAGSRPNAAGWTAPPLADTCRGKSA